MIWIVIYCCNIFVWNDWGQELTSVFEMESICGVGKCTCEVEGGGGGTGWDGDVSNVALGRSILGKLVLDRASRRIELT